MISTVQKGTAGVLTLGLVLAGCADDGAVLAAPAPDPLGEPQRYTTSAFIIQQGDEPPELCLSTVMESNPPQCGGPTVVGLDWADVPDAETVMGVTFGSAWVVGTYADETFTLTEPVSSEPPAGHVPPDGSRTPLAPLCDDPYRGGSEDAYPRETTPDGEVLGADGMAAMDAMHQRALTLAGYVEVFVSDGSDELNLLLTADSDAEAVHASLRELWQGWLCVAARDIPSAADGQAAMDALGEHADEVGLLVWSPDPTTGRFSADVVLLDASTVARIHEILAPWYDPDQIDLYSRLTPLG